MMTRLFVQRQIAVVPYVADGDSVPNIEYKRDSIGTVRCPYALLFVSTTPPLMEFASLLREAGWKLGLLAGRDDDITMSWPFETIVQTEGIAQGLQLAASSCTGLLAVPSRSPAAPTLDDLLRLDLPIAMLSSTVSVRHVGSTVVSSFSDLPTACQSLRSQCSNGNRESAESHLQAALGLRKQNYPHGDAGAYLAAAELFRAAALNEGTETDLPNNAFVLFCEACGDHAYYHEQDFLAAASFYSQGVEHIASVSAPTVADLKKAFYLKAIMAESIGLGLAATGEDALARQLTLEAIVRYRQASHYSSPETISCYAHTIAGLIGWAQLLLAKQYLASGHFALAEASLREAKSEYDEALKHQPLWQASGFSDQYSNTLRELESVEARFHELRGHG